MELMPSNTELDEPTVIINQPPAPFYKRRLLIFLTGTGVLLITFIALSKYIPQLPFLSVKEQVLSQVGDKKITPVDLDREIKLTWGVYAEKEISKKDSKAAALDGLIEKEIITKEAPKLGINVSNEEIQEKLDEAIKQASTEAQFKSILAGNGWTLDDQKEKIRYEILKQKLKEKFTPWRTVDYIGAFRNPADPKFIKQKKSAVKTLERARTLLISNKDVGQIVTELNKAFPNENIFHASNQQISGHDKWNPEFLTSILKANKGDVTDVIISDGGTMIVFKVLDINNSTYNSYDEWVSKMKDEYLK